MLFFSCHEVRSQCRGRKRFFQATRVSGAVKAVVPSLSALPRMAVRTMPSVEISEFAWPSVPSKPTLQANSDLGSRCQVFRLPAP